MKKHPLKALIVALVVVGAVVAAWKVQWHANSPQKQSAIAEQLPSPTPSPSASLFVKIKGRWLRPDGGYIIDVRDIDDAGKMAAEYYNPKSIHVATAEASRNGAATKVFIELRDVNYPGSNYTLTYDAQNDQLQGIYYQAKLQQRFEVFFVRLK